ncbi:hypothetical protein VNO77_22645 [Canavalia gladiata]|uniref:Uncharacterized protein n=1 Tax=Canavalia gladiata TaxID=3824 RepID=A0AAN9Q870_CANGL
MSTLSPTDASKIQSQPSTWNRDMGISIADSHRLSRHNHSKAGSLCSSKPIFLFLSASLSGTATLSLSSTYCWVGSVVMCCVVFFLLLHVFFSLCRSEVCKFGFCTSGLVCFAFFSTGSVLVS